MSTFPTVSDVRKGLPIHVRQKIRDAQVPLKYNEAIKALRECRTIDQSKHWADKSDALAAWAKIYSNDEVANEARLLKIYAYERMGELAIALRRPGTKIVGRGKWVLGPPSLLVECGLSRNQATSALALARAPKKAKNDFIRKTRLSAQSACTYRPLKGLGCANIRYSKAWDWLTHNSGDSLRLSFCVRMLRKRPAREIAANLASGEIKLAREWAIEVIEWFDEFEQALPKVVKEDLSAEQNMLDRR